MIYLHRPATTKRPLIYVKSSNRRWLTHLFSISTDSLPRGRYFYVESSNGSRISSLSPPTCYYQEAATSCEVRRWAMAHTSLLYLHRLLLQPRGSYFYVESSDGSHINLHRLTTTMRPLLYVEFRFTSPSLDVFHLH